MKKNDNLILTSLAFVSIVAIVAIFSIFLHSQSVGKSMNVDNLLGEAIRSMERDSRTILDIEQAIRSTSYVFQIPNVSEYHRAWLNDVSSRDYIPGYDDFRYIQFITEHRNDPGVSLLYFVEVLGGPGIVSPPPSYQLPVDAVRQPQGPHMPEEHDDFNIMGGGEGSESQEAPDNFGFGSEQEYFEVMNLLMSPSSGSSEGGIFSNVMFNEGVLLFGVSEGMSIGFSGSSLIDDERGIISEEGNIYIHFRINF